LLLRLFCFRVVGPDVEHDEERQVAKHDQKGRNIAQPSTIGAFPIEKMMPNQEGSMRENRQNKLNNLDDSHIFLPPNSFSPCCLEVVVIHSNMN